MVSNESYPTPQKRSTGRNLPPIRLKRAAAFLDISESALYTLTSSGAIAPSKPGGKLIYFEEEDLIAYLRRNRVITERK